MEPGDADSRSFVQVEAPCAMPEGYRFMAAYNGESFPVIVPKGGIQTGQKISVPYGSGALLTAGTTEDTPFIQNRALEHTGAWKDDLFDCCRFGPCHPSFLQALCCPQILMAQILTRLRMNWLGERAPEHEWKSTFRTVAYIVISYWVLTILLSPQHGQKDAPGIQSFLYRLVGWALTAYTLIVLARLRHQVRVVFDIPIRYSFFGRWEDICMSLWCGMCVISQLARQTCDYEEQPAAFWSPTGLWRSRSASASSDVLVV